MFVLYIASLTRSVIALHTLLNNKLEYKENEKNLLEDKPKVDAEKDKEKEKDGKTDKKEAEKK